MQLSRKCFYDICQMMSRGDAAACTKAINFYECIEKLDSRALLTEKDGIRFPGTIRTPSEIVKFNSSEF